MRGLLTLFAAIGMTVALGSGDALAQKLDANGKCRDAAGHFAKAEACAAKPAAAEAATNRCRDKTTKKFAKCDAANTEPVPSSTKKN